MEPNKIMEVMEGVYNDSRDKIALFIWGPPGVGKSQLVSQFKDKKNIRLLDVRLATKEPTDLYGLPYIEERQTHQAMPAEWPTDGEGVIMFDELSSAPPMMQAAAYSLILDRKYGGYEIPEGWAVFAAGNRQIDRGVVYEMKKPLANRFVHVDYEVSNGDWTRWAFKNDIDPRLIAFLNFKKELLFDFDPKAKANSFPTPRSWEFTDNLIKTFEANSPYLLQELFSGTVGPGAATDFMSFLELYEHLPNIQSILLNPEKAPVPDRTEIGPLHAVSLGLVKEATLDNLDNVITYLNRLPKEFAVKTLKELQAVDEAFMRTSAFIRWATDNKGVF